MVVSKYKYNYTSSPCHPPGVLCLSVFPVQPDTPLILLNLGTREHSSWQLQHSIAYSEPSECMWSLDKNRKFWKTEVWFWWGWIGIECCGWKFVSELCQKILTPTVLLRRISRLTLRSITLFSRTAYVKDLLHLSNGPSLSDLQRGQDYYSANAQGELIKLQPFG